MSEFIGKQVVIGLGETGLSCVRFLSRLGSQPVVIDTRTHPPLEAELKREFGDVPLFTGKLDQYPLNDAQELIVSPGLPLQTPAISKAITAGVPVIGDIELFARSVNAPVIAVTGSNGKSTVVSLIGKALESMGYSVCVAGNIGLPVLNALSQAPDVDVWVLELSSFQLETTYSLRAKVAVNLNLSEDHMDRYESMAEYAMAKQRIFDGCESAVYWHEDRRTKPAQHSGRVVSFGGNGTNHGRFYVDSSVNDGIILDKEELVLSQSECRLKGTHNLLNMAAAITTLTEFGVDYCGCLTALKEFSGLPHRCEWVANVNEVDWYNDSKGTNVGSTVAAIQGLSHGRAGRLIWLAGGDGKGADFSLLRDAVKGGVKVARLFGRDAVKIKDALSQDQEEIVLDG